jgi:predicted TPR repeat methyltransferase
LLLEAGQVAEAADAFEEILEIEPGFVPALFSRGLVRMQAGDADAAAADFRAVLERQPSHPGARHFMDRLAAGS